MGVLSRVLATISTFLICALLTLIFLGTYDPKKIETENVSCNGSAVRWNGGPFKALSWNIQYLAGKGYFFYYDVLDESGPDTRPSRESIRATLAEVVRVLKHENADVVFLQEVDVGARRTDYDDQVALIYSSVASMYPCVASTYYWKSWFVPHPKIFGRVGMKLATFSRFKITSATRYQLSMIPKNWLVRKFYLKRAVLETLIDGQEPLVLLNTHLDAFAQGSDTMQRQVEDLLGILRFWDDKSVRWVLGGDLNLLGSRNAFEKLPEYRRAYFNANTELSALLERYRSVPSLDRLNDVDPAYFTHFPNDPRSSSPDTTIDYLFYSANLTLLRQSVRQSDTKEISDHYPVIGEFR